MFLMGVFDPNGSIEDVGGVVKEVVSLLTFSEGLGIILGTAIWELQSTLFLLGPALFFLKPCLSLKKVESIKVLIGPNLLHCICSLNVWIRFPCNVPWKLS